MGVRSLKATHRERDPVLFCTPLLGRWWVGDPGVPLELLEPPVRGFMSEVEADRMVLWRWRGQVLKERET